MFFSFINTPYLYLSQNNNKNLPTLPFELCLSYKLGYCMSCLFGHLTNGSYDCCEKLPV